MPKVRVKVILKDEEFCEAEQKNQGVLIPLNNVRKSRRHNRCVRENCNKNYKRRYNSGLNHIEKIWSLVKRKVADKNVALDPKEIVKLTEEAFKSITADDWIAQCTHVEHLEEEYLKIDGLMDEEMDRIIISTASDSETEFDSVAIYSSESDIPMAADQNYSIKLNKKL